MKLNLCSLSLLLVAVFIKSYTLSDALAEENKNTEVIPLGTCNEYSDYYIYQCSPFKCELPIKNRPGVLKKMEVIGYQEGKCLYKYSYMIRNPKFPPTDFRLTCKLSERGRLEISNQFTRYKKGEGFHF